MEILSLFDNALVTTLNNKALLPSPQLFTLVKYPNPSQQFANAQLF